MKYALKISIFTKALGIIHIWTFLLDHIKIQYVYRYYSIWNIIEIFYLSEANIYAILLNIIQPNVIRKKNSKYF